RELDPASGRLRNPATGLHRGCTEASCFAYAFQGQFLGNQADGFHEFVNGAAFAKDCHAISIRNDLNIFASHFCSLNYQLLNSGGGIVRSALARNDSYTQRLITTVPSGRGTSAHSRSAAPFSVRSSQNGRSMHFNENRWL